MDDLTLATITITKTLTDDDVLMFVDATTAEGDPPSDGRRHVTTTATRTRAEIEHDIASKRRERELYVSAQGVAKCHAEIDALLDELEALG